MGKFHSQYTSSLSFSQNFIQPEEIIGLKDFLDKQILGFEGLVNMPGDFGASVDHLRVRTLSWTETGLRKEQINEVHRRTN